ncbi:MAG: DNA alkylation repair protein [Lachnospiraceae bacterium]|nr:DNA alkylation repair protein [Lachnospiraceae bacterium]
MNIQEIENQLEELSGNNQAYYKKVVPKMLPTLGVRVPDLRKIAKKIAKEDYQTFLKKNPLNLFEWEMLQAFVIGYAKDEIEIVLGEFENFIPHIHDWAVNDALCQTFQMARKYPKETLAVLKKYKDSQEEYEVRVVAVTLLSHFLVDEYIEEVIGILDKLHTNGYYAKMGVAWAVATIMAKYPNRGLLYLKNNNLDPWVYKKSIRKMKESYRVSESIKRELTNF